MDSVFTISCRIGVLLLDHFLFSAQGMLIYAGRNLVLFYECGETTEAGECVQGAEYVEVMFREKHVPEYLNLTFGRLLEDFCIDVDDLVPIEHEGCCYGR